MIYVTFPQVFLHFCWFCDFRGFGPCWAWAQPSRRQLFATRFQLGSQPECLWAGLGKFWGSAWTCPVRIGFPELPLRAPRGSPRLPAAPRGSPGLPGAPWGSPGLGLGKFWGSAWTCPVRMGFQSFPEGGSFLQPGPNWDPNLNVFAQVYPVAHPNWPQHLQKRPEATKITKPAKM